MRDFSSHQIYEQERPPYTSTGLSSSMLNLVLVAQVFLIHNNQFEDVNSEKYVIHEPFQLSFLLFALFPIKRSLHQLGRQSVEEEVQREMRSHSRRGENVHKYDDVKVHRPVLLLANCQTLDGQKREEARRISTLKACHSPQRCSGGKYNFLFYFSSFWRRQIVPLTPFTAASACP